MLHGMLYRIRALLFRRRLERELNEELAFHLDKEVEKQSQGGADPGAAVRKARIVFGGLEQIKEECRQSRGIGFIESTLQDLRDALRLLYRNASFAAAAIVSLSLGIAAVTAVFSIYDSIILNPVPFRNPQQLAWIFRWSSHGGGPIQPLPMLKEWRQQQIFEGVEAHWEKTYTIAGTSDAELVTVSNVTAGLFPLLGVRPEIGRNFATDEANSAVVIVSHDFWNSHLGADDKTIGNALVLNGTPFTIIGVMPQSFRFPATAIVAWLPFDPSHSDRPMASFVARVRPDMNLKGADSIIASLAPRLDPTLRTAGDDATARLQPLDRYAATGLTGNAPFVRRRRVAVLLVFGAGVLVLLVSCVNSANLFLSRAVSRTREIAVRAAIGGSRSRLIRHATTEALVLATIAGAVGTLFAWIATRSVITIIPPNLLDNNLNPIAINSRAAMCAVIASIVCALVAATSPAIRVMRGTISAAIIGTNKGGLNDRRIRGVAIVFESALALVLLIGAGLVGRSLWILNHVNPGWSPAGVLIVEPLFTSDRYASAVPMTQLMREVADRTRSVQGVRAAALASAVPFLSGNISFGTISSETSSIANTTATTITVSSDYFKAMGIPLNSGRIFTNEDDATANNVVISQDLANRLWPNQAAVGQRFRHDFGSLRPDEWLTVIGVVGAVQSRAFDNPPEPVEIYQMLLPANRARYLTISTDGNSNVTREIRGIARSLDSTLPLNIRTMDDVYQGTLAPPRFQVVVLSGFGFLTLCLAVAGVYAVVSYEVSRKRKEIGIRMALGARGSTVMVYVMRSFIVLGLVGLVAGALVSAGLTRLMTDLLYEVQPYDALTFAAAAVVLICGVSVGALIPAWRASRANPAVTLRCD